MLRKCAIFRDGEVPSQKELSSYFEELFSSKVPCQKELSSPNEELFPNPECNPQLRPILDWSADCTPKVSECQMPWSAFIETAAVRLAITIPDSSITFSLSDTAT